MSERKSRYELFLEEEAARENAPKEKRCSKCKRYKLPSEFYADKRHTDGLKSQCKTCHLPPKKYRDTEDRFWKRFWSRVVRVGECLEWGGPYTRIGMPSCYWKGTSNASVRRIVYRLACGDLPDDMFVITACQNKRCVRHSHLKLATKEDLEVKRCNTLPTGDEHHARRHPEHMARGERNGSRLHPERRPRGERHGCAKLTDDLVRQIRNLYANEHLSMRALARRFRVDRRNISFIVNNRTWKHVDAT